MIASQALLRSVAVVRFRIWLATALAFGALVTGLIRGQVNEEKRHDQAEESRGTLGIHSETKEISNTESKATSHSNTQPKNRKEESRREKKREIEVSTRRGDA